MRRSRRVAPRFESDKNSELPPPCFESTRNLSDQWRACQSAAL